MPVEYELWLESIPCAITGDSLWKMQAYRLGLYAADIGWADVTELAKDRRTWSTSDQLNRSLGSISANIAEGYSRGSGKDRVRFYEYALGSARESRDWYFKSRHVLGQPTIESRMELLARIIKLLLTMTQGQRNLYVRETSEVYLIDDQSSE